MARIGTLNKTHRGPWRAVWTLMGLAAMVTARIDGQELELVAPRPLDTVVARSALGEITIKDLQDFYSQYRAPVQPRVKPALLPEMKDDWIDQVAQYIVTARAIEQHVDSTATTEEAENYTQSFDNYLYNTAIPAMHKRHVEDLLVQPTDEEIEQYYNDHRPEFRQPFEFYMRHIFLMTYVPYEIRAGDSLESIAGKITGDKSQFTEIRSDVDTRPVRWIPPEERDDKFFKELEIGEKLLVPMSEQDSNKTRQRLESILQELKAGRSFKEMAMDYSEAAAKGEIIGPLPSGVRPMVGELLEQVKKTSKGSISEVFRTKHGWQVIELTEKKEEGYIPLDDARGKVAQIILKQRAAELEKQYTAELMARPELNVDFDKLASAPDIPDEEIVIRIGATSFIWKQFEPVWKDYTGGQPERQYLDNALDNFPPLKMVLALAWARDDGLFEEPNYAGLYKALRTAIFSITYMQKIFDKRIEGLITEEKIQQTYLELKEKRFIQPTRVKYRLVERFQDDKTEGDQTDEEEQAAMEQIRLQFSEELGRLGSVEDFMRLSESDIPNQRRMDVSSVIEEDLDEKMRKTVQALTPGQWSKEAFIEGKNARALLLKDRIVAEVVPLEQARDEIEAYIKNTMRSAITNELNKQWLTEIQYEFLLGGDQ